MLSTRFLAVLRRHFYVFNKSDLLFAVSITDVLVYFNEVGRTTDDRYCRIGDR